MLEAYMDVSRAYAESKRRLFASDRFDDRKAYALVGYLGLTERWECFDPKWIARLEKDGLKTFHMTDLLGGHSPFEGWDADRARPLIADLIDIVNDHVSLGIGCVVPLEDIEERPIPYLVCLQQCLELLFRHPIVRESTEPMALILDYEDGVRGAAESLLDKLQHTPSASQWGWNRITAVTFIMQKEAQVPDGFIGVPALPAADLVAFEHMATVHQHRPKGEERLSPDKIEGIPFDSFVLDRTLFDIFARQVRAGRLATL